MVVSSLALLFFAAASVVAEVEVNSDGVLVLTTDTFQEGISSADFVLVEFYAPWCGHCKALAPEYAKAATQLKEKYAELSVKLAMVDATVETSLGKDFGVRGYPTIKFFKKEALKEPTDYSGGRTADEIVNWVLKKTGPPAIDLASVDAAQSFVDAEEFVVVGFFNDAESEEAKAFKQVASSMDDVKFGISTVAAVGEKLEVGANKAAVFRKFDEPKLVLEEALTAASLKSFISSNRLPYVIEFTDENAPKIFGGDVKTHSLFFLDMSSEGAEALIEQYRAAAKQLKGTAVFVYLDISKESNARVMEFFNLKADDGTQYRVIQMGEQMKKYKPDFTEFTTENFMSFVQGVVDGKVKRHLNTEDVPEDWDKEPVKVLVGKNFDEVALDKSKDVLVEFYAPWCGHCKALAPIYEELGAAYKDSKDVVIAKVDSTKNEVEAADVQGFPTIYLFRKDDNKAIQYNGARTLEALKSFVESRGEAQADEDEEADDDEEEDNMKDEL